MVFELEFEDIVFVDTVCLCGCHDRVAQQRQAGQWEIILWKRNRVLLGFAGKASLDDHTTCHNLSVSYHLTCIPVPKRQLCEWASGHSLATHKEIELPAR